MTSDRLGGNAVGTHRGARLGRGGALGALLTGALLLGLAPSAGALQITGGPVYSLPGGGSCTVGGVTTTGSGATVTCTGVNLAAHTNVYFGVRVDQSVNGNTMTGAAPAAANRFLFSSTAGNTITYTGSTSVSSLSGLGAPAVTNTLNLTRTSGSASIVATGGTPADSGTNGQIQRLFKLTSGSSFTFDVDILANASGIGSGQACPAVYDVAHASAGANGEISKVDLGFYYSDCGDGVVDSPEQCDLGGANGTPTACCSATCTYTSGNTCRGSAGTCDLAETCPGGTATCPADAKSSALCRASGGVCDIAESCDGVNNACPADAKSSAQCRASGGVCDIAESCDGVNDDCPTDAKSTAVCRAAADACDVAEVCDGSNDACPSDAIAVLGATCRAVAGACDVAETCDGVVITCPADAFVAGGTECRAVADVCDVAEQCTGSGPACPTDAFEPATTVCRASSIGEVCDIPENCTGTGASCPADAVEPNTTECRGSAGVCDIAENCDGTNKTCPTDAVEPSSTVCRATSVGETCDVAETCDGTNVTCPADAVLPNGTICRASGGTCDIAEECDGVAKTCPSDAKSTAVCRSASGVCDVAEVCDGINDACPSDVLVADGTNCEDGAFCNGVQTCTAGVCGGGTNPCSMGESCDEVSNLCFTGNCPVTAATCLTADKNKVLIKNKADNTKDKLVWKWTKGAATTLADFSDPTTSANYALCFYAGTSAALIQQAAVPASATKWSPIGTKGFKYKDTGGTADGITKIIVKSGASGKSKALVKGKGADLPDFDSDLPIAAGDLPMVVQLRNNATGVCFQGSFSTPKKNQADQFNAKQP